MTLVQVAVYEIQMGAYDYDRLAYTGRTGMAYLVPYYVGRNFIDTIARGERVKYRPRLQRETHEWSRGPH